MQNLTHLQRARVSDAYLQHSHNQKRQVEQEKEDPKGAKENAQAEATRVRPGNVFSVITVDPPTSKSSNSPTQPQACQPTEPTNQAA